MIGEDESCADGWFLSSLHFSTLFLWIHLFLFPFKNIVDSRTHHEWGLSLCTEWINNTESYACNFRSGIFRYGSLFFFCSNLSLSLLVTSKSRGHPSLTKIYPVLSFRFGPFSLHSSSYYISILSLSPSYVRFFEREGKRNQKWLLLLVRS